MASTTTSASVAASRSVVGVIRARVASASSSVILPLAANRLSESRIAAMPRPVAASSTSRMVTCQPAWAETCAMPEPISPEPMTAKRPAMKCTPL
jgi:hypothetical protein